jgi:pimeloyl-ACP methyl ester carboxylesterase
MLDLVLLPGLGADARLFEPQRAAFPGLSVPAWPPPRATETLADYAARFAASRTWPAQFVLGGSSLGGIVALELARVLRPHAAVLLGSAASPASLSRHLRLLRPMAAVLPSSLLPRRGWPAQLLARYFGADTSEAVAVFLSMLNDADPAFMGWALRAISRWEPSPALAVPVLCIHGSRDRLMLCGADVDHVIDGAGHLLTITHAEQVNRALLDVLTRAEGDTTANG